MNNERDLFTPDAETEKQFKAHIAGIIAKGDLNLNSLIDMGHLPALYSELGIADKELKANTLTIFKALGLKGKNRHHVPKETLENLLTLVHDPEAVFKSLSSADNPNGYVAVLNTKVDNKPVVAILSPSDDGKGFTFIPSIYERNNFEKFVENVRNDNKILYIKEKGSWLWGRQQSPPRHNFKPYTNIILTKDDIVKRYFEREQTRQTKPAPAFNGAKSYHHKETTMEIESRDPVQELIPDEQKRGAFWNDFYSILRKQGIDPIEDTAGRGMAVEELEQVHAKELAFEGSMDATEGFSRDIAELFVKYSDKNLQMRDGQVINPAVYKDELKQESPEKTEAVESSPEQNAQARGNTPEERAFLTAVHQRKVIAEALKSGSLSCLPGADGYADTAPAVNIANGTRYHGANLLQLKEHQKQNGFPSAEYVTKDALEKSGVPLKPKQNGIDISFGVKNEETGKRENKFITLYNIGQSQNPKQLKAWGAAQIEEKIQDKMDYLKQRYGNAPQPHERKEGQSAPEISPKSAEPEKYLGAYLAAVSMGGKFKPSSEQAAEFSKNFETSLFQKGQNGHTDPFKLSKICNAASEHCKEVIKEVHQGQRREQTQQQKIEHTKSRGRSL